MPLVTCPDCLARFESSGVRGTSCPTCGYRLGTSRRSDDAPRRPSRRDEDDFDDRRPVRRPRRVQSTAADSLVPLLILGGALVVILGVAGVGFLVYRASERSPVQARVAPEVRPVESGPAGFAQVAPDDGLPGVNPADLAPGGQPGFGPPSLPQPDDPSLPGVDPGQVQAPPGAQQPPGMPGGQPAFPPRPGGGPRRGVPGMPQPPAMPQPPGATGASVTLSNLRRGRGAGTTLEVDYQYSAGARQPFDKLMVRTEDGTSEVTLHGPPQPSGTIRIRAVGSIGPLRGKVEVWMERRTGPVIPGASGQVISNTVTLN